MSKNVKGFTLIELLVVVIIIGIAGTIIVLRASTFFYSNRRSEFLARELSSLIDLARKQAIFSMSVIGIQLSANQYAFLRLDDRNALVWKSLGENDSFWAARQIPENIIVSVQSDQALQKSLFSTSNLHPQIIILPSGEVTPFNISIHKLGSTTTYTLSGNSSGGMKIDVTK